MMQKRENVFETNSSSSHSLTISKTACIVPFVTKEQAEKGVIEVVLADYNWEWRRYYTGMEKLRYLLSASYSPNGNSEEFINKIIQIEESTGCVISIIGEGSIDHESAGVGNLRNMDNVMDFLLDSNSYIETGNDNESPPWEIKTDRGLELYFEPRFKEPGTNYEVKTITCFDLNVGTIWEMDGRVIATDSRFIENDENAPVANNDIVFNEGICSLVKNFYHDSGWNDGYDTNEFLSTHQEIMVTRQFEVKNHIVKQTTNKPEKKVYTFHLPPELVNALEASNPLSVSDAYKLLYNDAMTYYAKEEDSDWKKRMVDRITNEYTHLSLIK